MFTSLRTALIFVLICLSVEASRLGGAEGSPDGGASALSAALPYFDLPVAGPPFAHRSPAAIHWAEPVDFDGNRRDEIIVTYLNYPPSGLNRSERVKVLKYDTTTLRYSEETGSLITAIPALVHPRVIAKGNFNGDGKLDVFIGGHGYDASPFPGERDWLLLSGAGSRKNGAIAPPGTATFTHTSAVGDINGDGIDDIYVGVIWRSRTGPYFLMGRKGLSPVADFKRLNRIVSSREQVYTSAALVGVNSDGNPDLVLGGLSGSPAVVYFNDGTGRFLETTPSLTLPPGLFGASTTTNVAITVADLNTDGFQDLLFVQTDQFYRGYGLQVLINNGHSAFVDRTSLVMLAGSGRSTTQSWKLWAFPADFYGDGLVDIVSAAGCLSTASDPVIWLNDGSGAMTPFSRSLFDNSLGTQCDSAPLVPVRHVGKSSLVRVIGASPTSSLATTYINSGLVLNGPPAFPQILRQPKDVTVAAGREIILSVGARGTRPLRFEWFKNGIATGARTAVLRLRNASRKHEGTYEVRITNAAGTRVSAPVLVVVS